MAKHSKHSKAWKGVILMQLGERVKHLRLEKKFTQNDLADKIYVSRSLISQIEHGKANPAKSVLTSLSDVLGTTVYYLVHGEDE